MSHVKDSDQLWDFLHYTDRKEKNYRLKYYKLSPPNLHQNGSSVWIPDIHSEYRKMPRALMLHQEKSHKLQHHGDALLVFVSWCIYPYSKGKPARKGTCYSFN